MGEGKELLPGHGEAGWPEAGACCSYCTVYMYCIGEEWVRVRRLLPAHEEAGWPEAGPAAAIVLFVLHRRRVGDGVEAAAGTRRGWLA